jgi:peptidoglycan/xylan/chitin deacetylase (PgdA/CDA1 family)
MTLVRSAKHAVYALSKTLGVMGAVRRTDWRQKRLMIMCYHGISLADEHEWNPTLYLRPETLESRLEILKREGYPVVPLEEGLQQLRDGTLPAAAVALTFDDGMYDFYAQAFPLLKKFGFPATVYQTTYYTEYDRPIFDVFLAYVLWCGRTRTLPLGELVPGEQKYDLRHEDGQLSARSAIERHVQRQELSGEAKDALAERLARLLDIDYDEMTRRRLLHTMRPNEVRELASQGVKFELHTHRHRTPDARDLFLREIVDNRSRIIELTGRDPKHFCYPSGVYRREYLAWLHEAGVVSATTCDPGMAHAGGSPLLLPRLIDTEQMSLLAFEAWLSGIAELLPRRTHVAHPAQAGA